MKEEWICTGVCCEECFKGVMKSMPEQVLDDGTVIHTSKCNTCENIEKWHNKPSQSSRRTGVMKCDKCSYEYFYCRLEENLEEMLELMSNWVYSTCPNCGIKGYQMRMIEHYGSLKHDHGHYGVHPITRIHRG